MRRRLIAALLMCAAIPLGTAEAKIPSPWKNCTDVNRVYPHGVGRAGAHDQGGDVVTFVESSSLYATAIGYNRGLDRDHDGIACEKP